MSLTLGIVNELDVSGVFTVSGVQLSLTGNRAQIGSPTNATLMVSDSGAFTSSAGIASASGAIITYVNQISGILESGNTSIMVSGSNVLASLNIAGANGVTTVLSAGNVLTINGDGGSYDPLGTAANTGQILYSDIIGLSGISLTQAALNATGNTLYADITGLSGQAISTYTPLTNTTLTGQILQTQLSTTGNTLYTYITQTSGTIGTTGTTLYNDITGISGLSFFPLTTAFVPGATGWWRIISGNYGHVGGHVRIYSSGSGNNGTYVDDEIVVDINSYANTGEMMWVRHAGNTSVISGARIGNSGALCIMDVFLQNTGASPLYVNLYGPIISVNRVQPVALSGAGTPNSGLGYLNWQNNGLSTTVGLYVGGSGINLAGVQTTSGANGNTIAPSGGAIGYFVLNITGLNVKVPYYNM